MKIQNISTIVFDLGFVLVDIDTVNPFKKIMDLAGEAVPEIINLSNPENLFNILEKGDIQESDFFITLNNNLQKKVPLESLKNIWNEIIIDFPDYKMEILEQLNSKYNVYLLSNTNAIHYEKFNRISIKKYGKPINSFFKTAFYSHELHMIKPYSNIYEHVFGIIPTPNFSCMYLDDKAENLTVPSSMGINTVHVTPEFDFKAFFKPLL